MCAFIIIYSMEEIGQFKPVEEKPLSLPIWFIYVRINNADFQPANVFFEPPVAMPYVFIT